MAGYEGGNMKEVEALETLDEYDDADYGAYLEYTELKERCMIEPTVLYIHENHEFLSEFKYFANADGLESKNNKWRYKNMLE